MPKKVRIGLVGAGANTRDRHIPGFLALEAVELTAVCNRRPESSQATADQYRIPRVYAHWQEVVADPEIDAILIGTWPYLHCEITVAALDAGKHVLTEARLAMNAAEAHRMFAATKKHPNLVTQVVPSPLGLKGHEVMKELIDGGFLGELREVTVVGMAPHLADPASPLAWRQDASLSGFNMLALGIVHETLLRWVPPPIRVLAQAHAHIPSRIDPQSGVRRPVGTPDSVQVLTILANGARASYHLSGVTPYGHGLSATFYGSEGVLHYDMSEDRITGAGVQRGQRGAKAAELQEIPIPPEKARDWRVEADFVDAIRDRTPIRFTDFATGVAYMEFTEAVARSAESGEAVDLPLTEL